jgi:hypothetical protein
VHGYSLCRLIAFANCKGKKMWLILNFSMLMTYENYKNEWEKLLND